MLLPADAEVAGPTFELAAWAPKVQIHPTLLKLGVHFHIFTILVAPHTPVSSVVVSGCRLHVCVCTRQFFVASSPVWWLSRLRGTPPNQ